ncbi:molybdenum cofactor guanylyltransferase [Desulfosarcina sp. OttesenSCG-928-A07]|nr:molybdenum cofactor guanylyltransferase [Desulfosarcina sp. OttesenSCG-928-G17]MDL2329795.1 molybdenum cofactor guanylyltransferase [Desulfosarcina sp. OttesenSCG-928-A07]
MAGPYTGVILAGGQGKRLGGVNKAFIRIGGKRSLDRIMAIYADLFDQMILVTRTPEAYIDFDGLIVTDHYACHSALNGIHAGLFAAKHDYAFFSACDAPFIKPELIACVLAHTDSGADVVVPETTMGYQPLFAAYRKTCLPVITRKLDQELLKVQRLFEMLKIQAVPEKTLRDRDPDLVSFFNMNTPEDQARAEAMARTTQSEKT